MLIQMCTARAQVPVTGQGIASVRGTAATTLTAANGNQGFVMAMDRASDRHIAIAAWSDDASLEAQQALDREVIADATRRLGAGDPTVEVFDLAYSHVVKTLRIGYWGRLVRIRVLAREAARTVERFRDTFVPGLEHNEGLAGASLFLNRETGDGYAVEWHDSLARLRGSQARGKESGQLMLAALPTLSVLDGTEVQIVIVEPPAFDRG